MTPRCTAQERDIQAPHDQAMRWFGCVGVVLALATCASCGSPVAGLPEAATAAGFTATVEGSRQPAGDPPPGMVWIQGGEFSMGCADPRGLPFGGHDAMADARPIHQVRLDGFWIDAGTVTNAEFAKFVAATDYKTVAERAPRQEDFPDAPPENLVAGSIVFTPPSEPMPWNRAPSSHLQWWAYVPGACWKHPLGPASSIEGHDNDPVVQVAFEDAEAYAAWAGKRLPTEAEWECAARGGMAGNRFPWGDEFCPDGKWMANTWQGSSPNENTGADGFVGIAPTGSYPANAYGVFDMAGNVWEWCSDWYRPDTYARAARRGVVENPRGPGESHDPQEPGLPKRVQRGGSFLCSEQYCARYIVGSRGKGEVTSATNHLGFRCVKDP